MIGDVVGWLQAKADDGSWAAQMLLALARRFVALEFFDRSLAIAAQMLVAFIPLVIGLTALIADNSAVAEQVIRRLGLTGASVEMVRLLFDTEALPEDSSGIGTLSVFFLVLSLYLLGKRVRHLYERAYDLPATSARSEWRSVWWVVLLALLVIGGSAARTWAYDSTEWAPAVVLPLSIALMFVFLWWSPRFLLARRLSWNHALPAGLVTGFGVLLTGIWSVVWLPRVIVDQAERFGAIGITFGIFTWLYALALALVAGALVAGAIEDVRLGRSPALRGFPV
jgi:uncharacterized BrkB/YihY/UPF0761 family membrane protein